MEGLTCDYGWKLFYIIQLFLFSLKLERRTVEIIQNSNPLFLLFNPSIPDLTNHPPNDPAEVSCSSRSFRCPSPLNLQVSGIQPATSGTLAPGAKE